MANNFNTQAGLVGKTNSSTFYGGQGANVSIAGQLPQPKPVLPPTQGGVIPLGQGSATDQAYKTHPGMFPSTPVTSIKNNADGSSEHKFAKPDTGSSSTTASTTTPKLTPEQLQTNTEANNKANYGGTSPAPLTTGGQIPGVLGTGQQTANESQMQQNVLQAGGTTPDEKAFQDQYVKATAGKQFGALAPYAESSMYAGNTPEQNQGLITAPDLAGRANADTGLFNTLGNAYGNAALAGLSAAQVSAARGLTAAQGAYSGAQTQAQRGASTATSVLGAVQPTQVSPGNTLVNPATAQGVYGLGTANGGNAYQNFSNLQFNTAQGQAYGKQASDLQTATNQTDQNFQTLSQLAGGLNLSQFPDINALNQAIQQKTGNAGSVAAFNEAYNALQTSIGQIINTSGAFTPSEIGNLTAQMSAAKLHPDQMQQLYDTVRKTAATKINTILEQARKYESGGTSSVAGSMPNASGASQPLGGTTGGTGAFSDSSFYGKQ